MATYVPAKINTTYIFYVGLVSRANGLILQANPTLAAGDVKVATDDGAPGNLTTLPVVDADFTKRVKVTLSAAEMNGGNVTVIFSDAAGAEWSDLIVNIQTSAAQIDDIPTSGEIKTAIEVGGSHLALIKAVTDVIPDAGALTTIDTNTARLTAVRAAVLTDWINAGRLDLILDAIKVKTDTLGGAGAISWPYTLTNSATGGPIDGAEVWVTSDSAGLYVLASGITDSAGLVTFMLDAGTVYVWAKKAGYNMDDLPDEEVVA